MNEHNTDTSQQLGDEYAAQQQAPDDEDGYEVDAAGTFTG